MPELPEVETIKRELKKSLLGKKIAQVKILSAKQFVGRLDKIIGARVIDVWRQAKLLGIELNNGFTVLTHLKLTGQLVFVANQKTSAVVKMPHPLPFADNKLPGKTTRIIIKFEDGSRLFFNDLRKFGWMKVVENRKLKAENLLYGPEPLEKSFTLDYLKNIFAKTRRAIKIVLMDQTKIAGLGNIYANEALFKAGIDPRRPANTLKEGEIRALKEAIVSILKEAIKDRGTSAADDAYIQVNARPGGYQKKLKVYQREGQPCFRCHYPIQRIKLGGRSAFFCPHCQK